MATNEHSQPGHRRSVANGVSAGAGGDDSTQIIAVGLSFQAWGAALAEFGRISRQLTRAQRAAAVADLLRIAEGFDSDFGTLMVGLRAEVRRNT
jgi:hypothetical protein